MVSIKLTTQNTLMTVVAKFNVSEASVAPDVLGRVKH